MSTFKYVPLAEANKIVRDGQITEIRMPLDPDCTALCTATYVKVSKAIAKDCLASFDGFAVQILCMVLGSIFYIGGSDFHDDVHAMTTGRLTHANEKEVTHD